MMRRIFFLFFCLSVCLAGCTQTPEKSQNEQLSIYFLDVGQGDCILIRTKSGDILVDAGPESAQEQLLMKLRRLGVTELELAVFTHSDEDHIGGADGVLREFPAKQIWVGVAPDASRNESERLLWEAVDLTETIVSEVQAGKLFLLGKLSIFVCAPMEQSGGSTDSNEGGVVLKLTYGETSALLMGDVGTETETILLERYGSSHLSSALLKVGHHGSSTSGSEAFLQAVCPTWAVISCAAGNEYGHPHGDALQRLQNVGATILRTDRLGDIVFECDGKTFFPVDENGG